MTIEEIIGLGVISIVCFFIFYVLIRKYKDNKNKFTLYISIFFIIVGFGWGIQIILIFMGIQQELIPFLMLWGNTTQIILLLFLLDFYEIKNVEKIILVVVQVLVIILNFLFPEYRIMLINTTIVFSINCIIFINIWRKNDDIKSLGFSIGLSLSVIAQILTNYNKLIYCILLIMASTIWFISYSGILEKIMKK